ncbi:hypothetical protein CDIK_0437 [Cucumispora dikerogammari]|nr:hypothetical protein CDIK_0437 [Cucumispora dikerogammari]
MRHFLPSGVSQNVSWIFQKGSYLTHILVVLTIILIFRLFLSTSLSIQLTVICYNIITFIFFHWIKGDPFETKFEGYTFWEQVVEQLEFNNATLFLGLFPLLLFFISTYIVYWDKNLYIFGIITLCIVVIPKLGFMHKRRIFGIK